jgi:dihydroorotate dehydrogenase electron transfer subunit
MYETMGSDTPFIYMDMEEKDCISAIRLVYRVTGAGTGTECLSKLKKGDKVDLIGPLGNGYDVESIMNKYDHPVLLGGGIGIPPMLGLADALNNTISVSSPEKTVITVLGYRDSNTFLADEFRSVSEVYIASEDGSVGTKGNVLDVLKEKMISKDQSASGDKPDGIPCDVIMACGPMPMLRAVATFARENGIKAYISLEERMACGVGACLGCVTKTREIDEHSQVKNTRICTEGPVFDADVLDL